MDLSNHLLHLRNENQLSRKELADILGVEYKTIERHEKGENLPRADVIIGMSKVYKCSTDVILNLKPATLDYFSEISLECAEWISSMDLIDQISMKQYIRGYMDGNQMAKTKYSAVAKQNSILNGKG